ENAVSQVVRQRIAGIACGLENRDGAALRHTTAILKGREEHTRLIILISDGKPVDKEYAGRHAIEDTRKALLEARQAGVRTFCITVDQKAPDYLPRMYRHSSWVVVNAVEQLPEKISPIFARLTT
ncbi:MAG: VWA domain-containing protein, partial [Desulfatitalea sp.]|nr:VWA domain-containing protein [Desulfatitalea sp.]